MTTNDFVSNLGVAAHTASIYVFINVLLISLCSSGSLAMAIPAGQSDMDIGKQLQQVGWRQSTEAPRFKAHSPERFIVTAKTDILLQIEEDGTVSGSKCKTEYAALKTITHTTSDNNTIMVIFAPKTNRYLCMNSMGKIYSEKKEHWNEMNCGFRFEESWVQSKEESTGKPIVYDLARLRHHAHYHPKTNNPLYIGIRCDGKPIAVHKCRDKQLHKKDIRFNYGNFNRDALSSSTCNSKPVCKRTYLKFCRNVMKNFFSTSVKNWRRFKRRKCFAKLKRAEDKNKKISQKCKSRESRSVRRARARRHSRRNAPT